MIPQSFDGEKFNIEEYRRPKKSVSVVLYSNQEPLQNQQNYNRSNSLEIKTFVPRPFPKKNSIQVTPFTLYNKYGVNIDSEVPEISLNSNSLDDIDLISVDSDNNDSNEDDSNSLSEVSFELCDENIEGSKTINELRSEFKRDKILFGYNVRSFNEYERIYKQSVLLNKYNNEECPCNYVKPAMFKKYIMFNEDKKGQRFSEGGMFSSFSGRSTRNSFSQQCLNFSLLDILESAANDSKDRRTIESLKGN